MLTFLRLLRLLSLVFWEGSLLFFAFVVAPTAFGVLPSKHLAGLVVAGSLLWLHRIGLVCGVLFLAATLLYPNIRHARRRKLRAFQMALAALMLVFTLYLQVRVIPAMERDRIAAGGDVDAAPVTNPARINFERLHPLSEKVEGAILFGGLGIVLLMAAEPETIDS